MKKILMLGGSNCQKNAIIRGESLGYEMILADYSKEPLAKQYAHHHVMVSTFDVPGCIAAAKEYKIDGVMTMGTDQPVLTVALVADSLRLPALISPSQAKAVTNKKIMKKIMQDSGIPTAKYRLIDRSTLLEDLQDFSTPLVLKPLDSQGQRGVFKLESGELALAALDKTLAFSRENEALLEEFYPSDEVTVSGWIQDSILTILTVTDRILLKDPVHIGICTSHRFPSIHMDEYEDIKRISEDIVTAFGLENGPLYIQMLIGDQGILVNEVAARIGGAFEDVIIPEISGFNILDAVILSALGQAVDVDLLKNYDCSKSKVSASMQLMFSKAGTITHMTPLEQLLKLDHVLDAGYNYHPGDKIAGIENATARIGHCVMVSKEGSIHPSVENFKKTFRILNEVGENIFEVFHD